MKQAAHVILSTLINLMHSLLFVCLTLSWCSIVDAGTVQGDHYVLGEKHVYLFGDNHDAGKISERDQQVKDFVDLLEETASLRNEPLHILWERASDAVRFVTKHKEMTVNLDLELTQRTNLPVTLEDTEIRKVGSSGHDILRKDVPMDWRRCPGQHEFDEAPALDTLTFKDMIESYENCRAILVKFCEAHASDEAVRTIADELELSLCEFELFMGLLTTHSISPDTNLCEFAVGCWKQRSKLHQELEKKSWSMYGRLYSAYLCYRVYISPGKQVAVVAGGGHIKPILSMLRNQGAELKVHCESASYDDLSGETVRLLSKAQLQAILKGYSLSYTISSSIERLMENALLCMLLARVYLGRLFQTDEPENHPIA